MYLRFLIALTKGVFDLQIDKKKKNTNLSKMNKNCEKKPTAHSRNILHVDALHNIKRKKYKTGSRFFIELVMFSLFAMQLDYCNIQRVFDVGTLTVYMFINCISMPENCFKSGKSCKMYAIFTKCSSSEVSFQHF